MLPFLRPYPLYNVVAMDIVHGWSRVLPDKDVNISLKCADIQASHRIFNNEITFCIS